MNKDLKEVLAAFVTNNTSDFWDLTTTPNSLVFTCDDALLVYDLGIGAWYVVTEGVLFPRSSHAEDAIAAYRLMRFGGRGTIGGLEVEYVQYEGSGRPEFAAFYCKSMNVELRHCYTTGEWDIVSLVMEEAKAAFNASDALIAFRKK